MDALELLDELEDIIDKGASVPFSGRCILDKDELLDVLQEIKLKLPDDLKQAKWIKEERQRILQEAQTEADNLIKSAEDKIIAMVNENEITKKLSFKAIRLLKTLVQMHSKLLILPLITQTIFLKLLKKSLCLL